MGPGWTCATCGEEHVGCATCFGEDVPHSWTSARRRDRIRGRRNRDTAVLGFDAEKHHFVRGHIMIPIVDDPEDEFVWSMWTTLSSDSWGRVESPWEAIVDVDPASGHQLAQEQRDGITWHRVAEINERLMGG